MADDPLRKKLLIKEGSTFLVLGCPEELVTRLGPITTSGQQHDIVVAFCHSVADINAHWPTAKQAIAPKGALWMAYPKLSGKIKSDITRDTGWETLTEAGWLPVTQISIDETWSALRFKSRQDIPVLKRKSEQ